MAIPPVIQEICADVRQLEQAKFTECQTDPGKPAVRTKICQDDPISVVFSPTTATGYVSVTAYGESLSVPSSTLTTIATHTVGVGKVLILNRIEASGENIAKFQVEIDAVVKSVRRTWWTDFNTEFQFTNLELPAGTIITVRVEHSTVAVGDFNATIMGIEGDV